MAKCPYSFVLPRPGGHDRFEKVRFGHTVQVVTGITIPCGKCLICRQNRAREWAQRLKHEINFHKQMCFVTLTYSDEYLPIVEGEKTIWKNDLQLFWKRLRKKLTGKIRYLACGEYGDNTSRPHYHAIILGWQPTDAVRISPDIVTSPILEDVWGYGQVAVGGVTDESVHYVTGYVLKKLPEQARGTRQREFIVASQGIGLAYAEMYEGDIKRGGLLTDGKDKGIPMYYRRKTLDKLDDVGKMQLRANLARRAAGKDARLEKELRSRSKIDPKKQVDSARQQQVYELEAKMSRSKRTGSNV